MTEAEWLTCEDPTAMLIFRFGPFERITDEVYMSRKNLLLACACFSHLGELIPPNARHWPELAAQAAEGCYEKGALYYAGGEEAEGELVYTVDNTTGEGRGRLRALLDLWTWNDTPEWKKDGSEVFWVEERKEQASLIRDIFGNPFRPITLNPSWLTSTVVSLARQIYESRDFSAMPILADALQDASCDNDEILNHCRGESVHVRGCYVVDLLLGKG